MILYGAPRDIMERKKKEIGGKIVNAFAFSRKCFSFPQEILHSLAKHLSSLRTNANKPRLFSLHLIFSHLHFPLEAL